MNEEAKALARDVLIKPFEGLAKRLPDGTVTSYPDPGTKGHPWTIGYGSTGPDIQPGTIWTIKKCEDALDITSLTFMQDFANLVRPFQMPLRGGLLQSQAGRTIAG